MTEPEGIEEEIGDRIREIRGGLGLTQREVAERCDLATETISRIERGVQGVTFHNVARIAGALDVPFSQICNLEVATDNLVATSKSHRIWRMIDAASPSQLDLLMEMAQSILDWSDREGSES